MYPPGSKFVRLTDAAVEPLTLAQAKQFLRVEISDDDDLISDLITAARVRCEQINDRSFITQTWQYTIDFLPFASNPMFGFPYPFFQYGAGGAYGRVSQNDGGITLPFPPLISLTTLTYVDMGGNVVPIDVAPTGNLLVSTGTPGRVYPAYGTFFPLGQPRPQAVNFVYTAGYGPDPTDVPRSIVTAIRFLLAHYYENRSGDVPEPQVVQDLLSPTAWGGYS